MILKLSACLLATLVTGWFTPARAIAEGAGDAKDAQVPPGMEEITLHFPKPLYVGPSVAPKVPHLELSGPSRFIKSFLAPEGTRNLALGRPVTSSDPQPVTGELALITNGGAECMEGNYVEIAPGRQWVQIDLGAASQIEKIVLWHFHRQFCVINDVIIQVSDDPEFKQGVKTLFNNDHDESSGLGKGTDPAYVETNRGRLIDGGRNTARFVRFWSNGNTDDSMNRWCEVQVFGTPAR